MNTTPAFEIWWKDHWVHGHNVHPLPVARAAAWAAWQAALEAAAKHFDGYTWGPYKSPAITIREMARNDAARMPEGESK